MCTVWMSYWEKHHYSHILLVPFTGILSKAYLLVHTTRHIILVKTKTSARRSINRNNFSPKYSFWKLSHLSQSKRYLLRYYIVKTVALYCKLSLNEKKGDNWAFTKCFSILNCMSFGQTQCKIIIFVSSFHS